MIEIVSVIRQRNSELLKILFRCLSCGNIFHQLTDKKGCILTCRYNGKCEQRRSAVVDIVALSGTQCDLKINEVTKKFDIYIPKED